MEYVTVIIKTLVPVFTLILGSALTYYYAVESKKGEAALKHKEEQYSKLLVKLQGFVGQTANSKTKREFFEEQYKAWLYCSDEVIEAINHMVSLVREGGTPDPVKGKKAVGNIVVAMRKDLYGKTKLDHEAFEYIDVIDRK
ncbi:hypothetical protein [Pseudoalteromonas viridis]|uniref:Uncharacterized protein n=1 Tax=Pseudoalteromonas viridis TaxID=339617 RepID=A0ABX7VAF4_9GAMM|nr:hypothetical protein [Pseudoalteromonas viridis]QTL36185.1 hypothetical protein J5X90_03800 [Pseudoalteromonas viridis]